MFTGIIEEKGILKKIQTLEAGKQLRIAGSLVLEDIKLGDSIAVNGICLTVTAYDDQSFTVDVMQETLATTSLKQLGLGSSVNLERAMLMNGRFGGHIVSGHIDGTGRIISIKKEGIAVWYTIEADLEIMKYIIYKGSITVDGISLTVARVTESNFSVSIIPHTARHTNLSDRKVKDIVNLENDIVGKYIEKFAQDTDRQGQHITENYLLEHGFL